ncbi:hypothetical protein GE09DRAFT_1230770 [Coniochaeta sp. 2T2.1]|nr:hypothetical protein GE09DRAFT_1230770 [Coniochaeta sp. 2T2.1]
MSTPSGSKDKGKAREVAADAIRDNAKKFCIRGEFLDFDNAVGEEVSGFLFGLA